VKKKKDQMAGRPVGLIVFGLGLLLVLVPVFVTMGYLRGQSSPARGGVPSLPNPSPLTVKDGPPAPDFAIETLDGGRFVLSDYRGRVVVVYFMAGWCLSCVPEARALARLYAEYHDRGLEVLAVDAQFDESPADVDRFRRQVGTNPPPDYRWAIDRKLQVVTTLGVRSLDTTIVIDPQGRIVYRDEVPTPYEILRQAVEAALQ